MLSVSSSQIVLFVFASTCFQFVWGSKCLNSTTQCNLNQVLITDKNCSKCICKRGYFHHRGLGGCKPCGVCKFPYIIVQNCTHKSNTECRLCQKHYFHTKTGCKKCQECEHGVLEPCAKQSDTICALKTPPPTTLYSTPPPTTLYSTEPTFKTTLTQKNQSNIGNTGSDCESQIWYYLFILESVLVAIFCAACLISRNSRKCHQKLYTTMNDSSSLATNSMSSLMLNSRKYPDINCLTDEECQTPIRNLPGLYAEVLGLLLNPNVANNWVQLAYEFREFKFTLNQIANMKTHAPECTQNLLLMLATKDSTTVERLWRAMKNIKRDDACAELINFMLQQRDDNESATVFLNEVNKSLVQTEITV